MKTRLLFALAFVLAFSSTAFGQQLQRSAPKTKLETFTGETGTVLVKGYTDVGSILTYEAGAVFVTAMSLRSAQNGQERQGITIKVGNAQDKARSFIDYDEIAGLLAGIDYVDKVDSSVTKLENFEVSYTTKGDFQITVFNDSAGKRSVAIKSGTYPSATAYLTLDELARLKTMIITAKDTLDKAAD